jgi:O-acetyl-ADP-ribose deacetylase (regulator of RNase III)
MREECHIIPFSIIRDDITKQNVDVIVNAANNALQSGGGVCGAIFSAAGVEKLQKACNRIGSCETGKAVITKGYALHAKHIIHTVGPVWSGGDNGEAELLYSCYRNSLKLAKKHKCESIAFPLISSGIYGYPKDKALRIAVTSIGDFLLENDMTVTLVIFDKDSYALSEVLYSSIKSFIDDNYADTHYKTRQACFMADRSVLIDDFTESHFCADESISADEFPTSKLSSSFSETRVKKAPVIASPRMAPAARRSLSDVLTRLDETFSQRLLRLIDEKGCIDTEVYKRANIDRRVFSKIRSNKDYRPSKNTALAFAIALELSLDDTRDLLMKAGFALSRSNKQDVIVEYFINEKNYNIFEINEALFAFEQSLLGA